MPGNAKRILFYLTLLVVFLYFFFLGLTKAKAFLAPLAVAALLAMVILPLARWFERKGVKRGWAALFSDLVIVLFFGILAGVLSFEAKSFAEDWPKIKKQLEPKVTQLQQFIHDKTGIPVAEQIEKVTEPVLGESSSVGSGQAEQPEQARQPEEKQGQQSTNTTAQSQEGSSMLFKAGSFIMKFLGFLATALLTLVYIFFFLLYRDKFTKSIIKLVPGENKGKTKKVITDSVRVSQNYLLGKLALCVLIAILYSIGLSISGLKHAIIIAVLASILTLIPYLGNIIGFGLALAMAFISGGSTTTLVGVTLTFGITQFLETYTLEPYVVGGKVNLNPIITIIVVVLGNAVWGVVGMLIAIPALGIAKVIFDHIPALHPLGYLFGQEGTEDSNGDDPLNKVKHWAQNKFKS